LFELAGKTFSAAVGDFVHAPNNEPHVFQNTSEKDGIGIQHWTLIEHHRKFNFQFARLAAAISKDWQRQCRGSRLFSLKIRPVSSSNNSGIRLD
jgi:hypothetical protein